MAISSDNAERLNGINPVARDLLLGDIVKTAQENIATLQAASTVLTNADAALDLRLDDLESGGIPFTANLVATIAEASAGKVLIDASAVAALGAASKVYLINVQYNVSGGTAWDDGVTATFSKAIISDDTGNAMVEIAKAGLAGNAVGGLGDASVTRKAAILSGGVGGEGLKLTVDAAVTAGSNLKIQVSGFIVPAI